MNIEKDGILTRLICKNCNYMYFDKKYGDKIFCTKDCFSSYHLKYSKKKMKLIYNFTK